MAYKDDPDFSKKMLKRSKHLYDKMESAHKTHSVTKEMAAEKAYYGDKYVKRQGKKQYEDVKHYYNEKAKQSAGKEIDRAGKRYQGKKISTDSQAGKLSESVGKKRRNYKQ